MKEKPVNINKKTFQKPKRFFEKSGTVDPEASYYVPLENVVNPDNQDIKTMVDRGRYFSIFAPRQSGKTTFLKHFFKELHQSATYAVIFLSFQKYNKLDQQRFYAQVQNKLYRQLIERLTAVECRKLEEIKSFLAHHDLIDHISFGELFEELNRIIEFKNAKQMGTGKANLLPDLSSFRPVGPGAALCTKSRGHHDIPLSPRPPQPGYFQEKPGRTPKIKLELCSLRSQRIGMVE
jgi:hypothetical protein